VTSRKIFIALPPQQPRTSNVKQSMTQIFLPNPEARRDDYVLGFNVTEAEYNVIKNLGKSSGMFLAKQGNRSAVVKFDLSGMPRILNVISGTANDVELLNDMLTEIRDARDVRIQLQSGDQV
jgi:type IV secretion system protein VirB4